mmetsp:Transcript_4327/g.6363  ORF Transcript_4327/g.6363 Transcript_4327/m.6363 type:complete len:207 (-) Transcript_4327:1393-2013(-)
MSYNQGYHQQGYQQHPQQYQGQQQGNFYNNMVPQQPPMQVEHPLKKWFDGVDKDKSGVISAKELSSALSKTGINFSKNCARKLIRMFDKSGNSRLNFNEFEKCHNYIMVMQQAYNSVDTDRSGTLSYQEVSNALRGAGYRLGEQTLMKLFNALDSQKTGNLNLDGYIELCVFIGTATSIFKRHDQHKNGTAVFTYEDYIRNLSTFI